MPETKKCPYCGGPMTEGCLYAPDGHGIYWCPREERPSGWVLTTKNVHEAGGFVLGEATKIGFFAKNQPVSYVCKHCGVIITHNK